MSIANAAKPQTTTIADLERIADTRTRIAGLVDLLGVDELEVIELVAHGLVRGRAVYGEMLVEADRRDFGHEGCAELRDALVYIGGDLLRLLRTLRNRSVQEPR